MTKKRGIARGARKDLKKKVRLKKKLSPAGIKESLGKKLGKHSRTSSKKKTSSRSIKKKNLKEKIPKKKIPRQRAVQKRVIPKTGKAAVKTRTAKKKATKPKVKATKVSRKNAPSHLLAKKKWLKKKTSPKASPGSLTQRGFSAIVNLFQKGRKSRTVPARRARRKLTPRVFSKRKGTPESTIFEIHDPSVTRAHDPSVDEAHDLSGTAADVNNPSTSEPSGPVPEVLPQAPTDLLPLTAVPSPPFPPAFPPPFPAEAFSQSLSTQEILRPSDSLRKSIEAFLLDQRSPHTRLAYGKDLKRFVKFLHARKQDQGVEKLNRMILIAYKESLIEEKLEHTTIDRHLATLKSFFNWLVEDGLIFKSPAEGVRFLNPKRLSTTQGFSDEEVKRVLAMPDLHTRVGSLHYAILMVLFYCGLRRSEICALRTKNIGVERNQRVLRLRGKGNSERMIVMIPPVWNAVRYYLHISGRNIEKEDSLFTPVRNNRTGTVKKPLDPSMIFYIVRKYSKQAGISNRVSPHSCRATAISNARDHHVPDRAIQEFAGWASTDMITRYDKRRTSIEESAAHSIQYGAENRSIPAISVSDLVSPESPEAATGLSGEDYANSEDPPLTPKPETALEELPPHLK